MVHIIVVLTYSFMNLCVCVCVCVSICIYICICKLQERECLLGAVVDLTALGFRASLRHRESTLVWSQWIMDYVEWIILRHRKSTLVLVTAIMDYVEAL